MWSDAAVSLPVLSGQHLRLPKRVEDLSVQQLVTQLAVETLHIAVLPRRAGLDVMSVGSEPGEPGSD